MACCNKRQRQNCSQYLPDKRTETLQPEEPRISLNTQNLMIFGKVTKVVFTTDIQ
jgi:hypothetical protein